MCREVLYKAFPKLLLVQIHNKRSNETVAHQVLPTHTAKPPIYTATKILLKILAAHKPVA